MSAASPRCAGVLFDLDGTLLDSAPDLAAALAVITREQGVAMPDYARVRAVVSAGGSAVLRTAWPQAAPGQVAALLPRYLDIYAGMLAEHTRMFPGIDALLARIERAGLPWGIVTNKIEALTLPLLQRMGLAARAGVVVCGDTLAQKKPDPAPVLHACAALGIAPDATLFVGDDRRDVEAGRAAGVSTIAVGWGYSSGENPADWQPDVLVQTPAQLAQALGFSA
ncbi:phosphoglycolate phosphatase [Metallibacterium sp.]|jgi:phosphoglycolate phosphatase|uniref:phosphoglycolate phosphatase n=1 Tax=Metallibacterium sp. TaxID=2940281 RepID=UPI0026277527|nr:phosphoglycolate phosphatase [Metallibacterium sp.]